MPAYVIATVTVNDPAKFKKYGHQAAITIEQYGGKYLVRGGNVELVEGDWNPKRIVVLEFPTMEQAKTWYNSAEYHDAKQMRFESADTNLLFVDGI